MTESEGLERLSGDYNKGFTAGIKAVQNVFEYIEWDLNHHHKRLTPKLAKDLLACCLINRERLRESVRGFIRWNSKIDEFEFYEPRE